MLRVLLLYSLKTNFILAPAIKSRHNIFQDYSSTTAYPPRVPVAWQQKFKILFFHESNIIISLDYSY